MSMPAACAAVLVIHGFVVWKVGPHPILNAESHRRVVGVVARKPHSRIVICGDSRAAYHVIPDVIARATGLPPGRVVNVGLIDCDGSETLALYREFKPAFAPRPICVMSASAWSVNDGVRVIDGVDLIGEELLASLSLRERAELTSWRRAAASVFTPERVSLERWWFSLKAPRRSRFSIHGEFTPLQGTMKTFEDPHNWDLLIDRTDRYWFADGAGDGIKWRRFQQDLRSLREEGAQLVLFNSPFHPRLFQGPGADRRVERLERFNAQLDRLCEEESVPLLKYDHHLFAGEDADRCFSDVTHLNLKGAYIFSTRLGDDLRDLIREGKIDSSPSVKKNQRGPAEEELPTR